MAETVLIGPVTYVIDNPVAARVARAAQSAMKDGNMGRMRSLRRIAALIEEGKINEDEGLKVAEL